MFSEFLWIETISSGDSIIDIIIRHTDRHYLTKQTPTTLIHLNLISILRNLFKVLFPPQVKFNTDGAGLKISSSAIIGLEVINWFREKNTNSCFGFG